MKKYLITIDEDGRSPLIVETTEENEREIEILDKNAIKTPQKNDYEVSPSGNRLAVGGQASVTDPTVENKFPTVNGGNQNSNANQGGGNKNDGNSNGNNQTANGSTGKPETENTVVDYKKKTLLDQIQKINDEYDSATGMTFNGVTIPKVEEKVYKMPTEEQIKAIVSQEVSPTYDVQKEHVKQQGEAQTAQLKEQLDELEEAVKKSMSQLKKSYGQAKENASNEALKRGLGRSSIILNQLQDLEKGEISSLEELIERNEEDKAEVNEEIRTLTQNIMSSLSGIDEKKAAEIAKGVRELTKEYQKEQEEVLEYNNKLKAEQSKLLAELIKDGITPDEKSSEEYIKMISSKTKALFSYYATFGKKAVEEIEKDADFIKDELGAKGYNNLKQYFA